MCCAGEGHICLAQYTSPGPSRRGSAGWPVVWMWQISRRVPESANASDPRTARTDERLIRTTGRLGGTAEGSVRVDERLVRADERLARTHALLSLTDQRLARTGEQ